MEAVDYLIKRVVTLDSVSKEVKNFNTDEKNEIKFNRQELNFRLAEGRLSIENILGENPVDISAFKSNNKLIQKSANFAKYFHRNTFRKLSSDNEFVHVFRVAQILDSISDDDVLIRAGFLHDTLEDTPYTEKELRVLLNDETLIELIKYHTEDKTKSWLERKQKTIDEVAENDNQNGIKLIVADRIANMEDIREWQDHNISRKNLDVFDFEDIEDEYFDTDTEIKDIKIQKAKDEIWNKFNAGKEKQKWYFESIYEQALKAKDTLYILGYYKELMDKIF